MNYIKVSLCAEELILDVLGYGDNAIWLEMWMMTVIVLSVITVIAVQANFGDHGNSTTAMFAS